MLLLSLWPFPWSQDFIFFNVFPFPEEFSEWSPLSLTIGISRYWCCGEWSSELLCVDYNTQREGERDTHTHLLTVAVLMLLPLWFCFFVFRGVPPSLKMAKSKNHTAHNQSKCLESPFSCDFSLKFAQQNSPEPLCKAASSGKFVKHSVAALFHFTSVTFGMIFSQC